MGRRTVSVEFAISMAIWGFCCGVNYKLGLVFRLIATAIIVGLTFLVSRNRVLPR